MPLFGPISDPWRRLAIIQLYLLAPVRGLNKPHKKCAPYLLDDFSCLVLFKPRRENKFKGILLLGTKQKQSLLLNSIINHIFYK